MIKTYKELINASPFYQAWNGTNQELVYNMLVKTSNRLLIKYHNEGKDNTLNTVALKQIIAYETYENMVSILSQGLEVVYQTHTLKVTMIKGVVRVTTLNLKTSEVHNLKVSKTSINKLSRIVNNVDVVDCLQALLNRLYSEGLQ